MAERRRSELQGVQRQARPTKDAQRRRAPTAERGATDEGCASAEDADGTEASVRAAEDADGDCREASERRTPMAMAERRRSELQAVLRAVRPSKDAHRQRTPMAERRRGELQAVQREARPTKDARRRRAPMAARGATDVGTSEGRRWQRGVGASCRRCSERRDRQRMRSGRGRRRQNGVGASCRRCGVRRDRHRSADADGTEASGRAAEDADGREASVRAAGGTARGATDKGCAAAEGAESHQQRTPMAKRRRCELQAVWRQARPTEDARRPMASVRAAGTVRSMVRGVVTRVEQSRGATSILPPHASDGGASPPVRVGDQK